MTDETDTPLETLEKAIQDYVNATDGEGPVLLRSWVLVRETVKLRDDGQAGHKVTYVMSDGCGMGECIGLLEYGKADALDDLIGTCSCDD